MEETIGQRLNYLLESNGKTQKELAEYLKASESSITGYKNDANKPSLHKSGKICTFFGVNLQWFLTGEGDKFSKPESENSAEIEKEFSARGVKRLETQSVPLFDFEASAGLVKLFDSKPNVLDYIQIPNMPRCDGAIHITGDSMYPLLKSGDIVMYKVIPDIRTGIIYGNMYLLSANIGGEVHTLVKYVQKSDLGDEYVRLGSQNTHHDPIDILRSDIKALAFVKASIRINSMS